MNVVDQQVTASKPCYQNVQRPVYVKMNDVISFRAEHAEGEEKRSQHSRATRMKNRY
jgi:hypothetical protein